MCLNLRVFIRDRSAGARWLHPCHSTGMRTRNWLSVVVIVVLAVVTVLAVVPAATALPFALAVLPLAILEPGSLLLLGITLLTLAGVAQRILFS